MGTEDMGLFRISPDRSQIHHMNTQNNFNSITLWNLYVDGDFLWIGTDKDGLARYNIGENTFVFYNKSDINEYQAGSKIKFIAKFQDMIWIASATEGLSYYSYQEDKFYSYQKDPYSRNSIYDNDVSGIFAGQNGVMYVGFYTKGFDKLISVPFYTIQNDPKQENSLSNNNVYSMLTDREGMLWFGTFGGGLNKYNPQTNSFKRFLYDPNDNQSLSHDWIRIIYEDRKERLWVGTWGGGLNLFDKKTGKSKRYLPDTNNPNSINHNIITAVFEDAQGELWIGTYGGGINKYREETDDFLSIVHNPKNPNTISDDHITSFYQDKTGIIWICTYGGGLNAYNKSTRTFKRFMPDFESEYSLNTYKTLHIYEEPAKGYFWITTLGGGINKFYFKENKFLNYTESDGLSNNSTMGMLKDATNMYWISSNNGLTRFDPQKEMFTNYTTLDGLASDDYNLEAFTKTADGTMYFGGKNGITYFHPNRVHSETTFPKIRFTKISVGKTIYNSIPEKIEIPYKGRSTFEFAAINPNKTKVIEYAYQLVGQDEEWRLLQKNRYLEFENLDPGRYELRIKSTNSDKIWNQQYTSIPIVIPTPWYLTWFFRIGLLTIILLVAYGYYRVKLNRIEKQNRELEKKVQERTQTIQDRNVALSKQKAKTEKAYVELKKLENFKHEFTSMLAHDLKNPLVTILGYSSDDSNNSELKSINRSGRVMLDLIENMLEVQKFENAGIQLRLDRVNLQNLVLESIKQVHLLKEEKRINIQTDIPAEIMVNADKDIVERVLINLLTNAIKFSSIEGMVKVFVHLDDTANRVKISVKDNGVGIPKDQLSKIFSKFSQVEAKKMGVARSTGLGLTFCKMAVEAHDCEIGVVSEKNIGSKFYFYLPRLEDSIVKQHRHDKLQEKGYENPMSKLALEVSDVNAINKFKEKMDTLSIYETGAWLDIFEELNQTPSENLEKWKQLMMEALTSFDESAFLYLKEIVKKNN